MERNGNNYKNLNISRKKINFNTKINENKETFFIVFKGLSLGEKIKI